MPFASPEQKREYDKEYSKRNRNKRNAANQRYFSTEKGKAVRANVDSKKRNAAVERWRQRNKAVKAAGQRKRYADKLNRTPLWANIEEIICFYKNCPKGYHVDHIVPLKGIFVSGLHVLDNLQYLSALENVVKSNKFA